MFVNLFQKALYTLGFSADDIVQLFKVVASVLKLGNIGFTPTSNIDGTEGCTVNNDYGTFLDFCRQYIEIKYEF
jgi:myosin heavy subunit